MIKLSTPRILFDAVTHTYTLDGNQLSGITSVLHDRLFPDQYRDVPEEVLNKAAQRGTRVHTAIELYDTCDILTSDCPELLAYQSSCNAFPFLRSHLATEYLVTDNYKFASAIDKVYEDAQGGVILADIKTTSVLNLDYVSWQLSIYAYFFSLANPDIPITGLYALWFRSDKHKVVEVPRHTEDEVKKLLYTTEPMTANTIPDDFNEDYLLTLKHNYELARQALEGYKASLLLLMEQKKLTKIDGTRISITRKADSQRTTFDTKRFKADHSDIYNNYITTSTTKGGLLIKEK